MAASWKLEAVLQLPHCREERHPIARRDIRPPCTHGGGELGAVRAQERVGGLLLGDGARNGRPVGTAELLDGGELLPEGAVSGLERRGEAEILLGEMMAAVDTGVVRQ